MSSDSTSLCGSHLCHWPQGEQPDLAAEGVGHCHVSIVQTDHMSVLHEASPTGH